MGWCEVHSCCKFYITMKTLLTVTFLLVCLIASAQDDNKIIKEIKGVVEVDGHLMKDSVKFYIQVDLDGFKIKGSNGREYQKRVCGNKECKIIHLEAENKHIYYTGGSLNFRAN